MNVCDHWDKSNIILEKKLANFSKGLVKSIQAYGQQYAKWILKSNKYSGHILFFSQFRIRNVTPQRYLVINGSHTSQTTL